MLVSFTFKNWKSFRDETTLDLTADRSLQHRETVAASSYYDGLKILPVATVYGGNAAGKSNLFQALQFVQRFVTSGRQESDDIPTMPFALDDSRNEPSSFSVIVLVPQTNNGGELCPSRTRQKELLYRLKFEVDRTRVLSESLSWFNSQREERTLYSRDETGKIVFSDDVRRKISPDEMMLLQAAGRGAGPRRLFLTNAANQQIDTFSHVYNWFKTTFSTADNGTQFSRSVQMMNDEIYCDRFGKVLKSLGTGVDSVSLEDVPTSALPKSMEFFRDVMSHVPESSLLQMRTGKGSDVASQIYVASKHDGEVRVRRVQTYRQGQPFGFKNESSGTRRLLEVLPIFMDLWGQANKVWVLDEIEREFHAEMTRQLLDGFIESCKPDSRTQLLLNTHDLMLMDQDLFRKDEIFVVEREDNGSSNLIPLSCYSGIRNDLDLRRSYLDGRFGGMPSFDVHAFDEAIHD